MSVGAGIRLLVAAVFAVAAVLKLARAGESRAALRSWGIRSSGGRRAAWLALVLVEAGLAIALATGLPWAPEVAAALLSVFALALAVQLMRGHAGAPCGCFGGRSRIGLPALLRTLVLAAVCVCIPALSRVRVSMQGWLVVGLLVALVAIAGLVVAVVALAREVGELRLSLGPQFALSIAGEGPELGGRLALVERFEAPFDLALGVFSSATCPICEALEPAVRLVGREPGVSVQVFDEAADADVWGALAVPGSPYAVVLDEGGAVVSKGTFNTLAQLEGVLAEGERRRMESAHV